MKSYAYNVKTIKNDNRALILNLIRKAPISRADISKRTGLSKSSVTMITNALIAEGQICEIGTEESSVGRKPILLDIVANFRFAIGITLHRHEAAVCITDLKSELIASTSRPISDFSTADEILDYVSAEAMQLVRSSGLYIDNCIGIGISSPGPLDHEKGVIISPPDLDILKNLAVVEGVKIRTGMKNVVLENNAVLLAMRENVLQYGKNMHNFMSVIVSHGIGSAVVTGGEIYRGAGGFCGEIGHMSVVADGVRCACGNTGCLEKYVSLDAVKEHFGFPHYHDIVDKAYVGDKFALEVLRYITKYLGSGLVTAVNLFDLDAIILHGDYCYRSDLITSMIRNYVERHSFVSGAHDILVISSTDRRERAESNSTAAILEQYFDQILEE